MSSGYAVTASGYASGLPLAAASGYTTVAASAAPAYTVAAAPATYTTVAAAPATYTVAAAPAITRVVAAPAVAVAAAPALNVDPNPQLIRKKPAEKVHYRQEVAVRFLKPPPPAPHGDIVIKQERDVQAAPAPPLHVKQRPPQPIAPPPMIVRERPPAPPPALAPELITIPGKVIPPPPRQVITERLPVIPPPPQNIVVERWLDYPERVRRVVFQPAPRLIPAPPPKNVLIQWDSPDVALAREVKHLGIVGASPADYAARFGGSLVDASQIPSLAQGVRPGNGELLAVEGGPKAPRLVGDLHALALANAHRGGHVAVAAPAIAYAAAPAVTYAAPAASGFVAASGPAYTAVGSDYAASGSVVAASGYATASAPAFGSGYAF